MDYRFWVTLFFFMELSMSIFAQNQPLDSLEQTLNQSPDDTNKVLILNKLALKNIEHNLKITENYLNKGLILSRKLGFRKGELILLNLFGNYHRRQGNYVKSIDCINQSLKIAQQMGSLLGMADNYRQLSIIYSDGLKQYNQAIEFSQKALQIYTKVKQPTGIANSYSRMARIYALTKQNLDLALQYINKSISIGEQIKDVQLLAWFFNAKGEILEQRQDIDSALFYFNKAIGMFKEVKNPLAETYNKIRMANIYLNQEKYSQALSIYEEALLVSQTFKSKEYMKDIYKGMAKCYASFRQFDKAYQYQELHTQLKDSLFNQEIGEKISLIQVEFEKEKQNAQISLLEKEKKIAIEEKRVYILIFLIGIFSFLIILSLIIFNNQQQKKANLLLQEKNEEIAQQAEELQVSNEEVMAQRDILDEKVQERTQTLEIAHEKLRNYAFSNSHKVRRPVGTILGLLYLFNKNNMNDTFNLELLEMLAKTAQELDDVTREINQNLENLEEEEGNE